VARLLIVGLVVVVLLALYATERIIKARAQARRLGTMSDRLTAATVRVDEEQEQRQAVARASAELTSFMPAIKSPPLTVPGSQAHGSQPHGGAVRPEPGCERTGPHESGPREHGSARPGRRPGRAGEHQARTGEQTTRPPADQTPPR
jgi:hypothetical protein